MSVEVALLVATTVLAVIAVAAAVLAFAALRQMRRLTADARPEPLTSLPAKREVDTVEAMPVPKPAQPEPVARVVEGRVIVQPTQEQAVAAVMTRPRIRIAILGAGLAHALRPESRDRIAGLVRREYRARRRARSRAARAASRATHGGVR